MTDVLREVTATSQGQEEKKMQVNTDELDEKDVAIQMLSVFISEVPEGCYNYLQQISDLLTTLLDYAANSNIRCSSAMSLPYLIKSAKINDAD